MILAEQIITATMPDFCQMSGLGKNSVYEMMRSGQIRYVKKGKRLLIFVDSYREWCQRQLDEGVPVDHSCDAALKARQERRAAAEEINLAELGL